MHKLDHPDYKSEISLIRPAKLSSKAFLPGINELSFSLVMAKVRGKLQYSTTENDKEEDAAHVSAM